MEKLNIFIPTKNRLNNAALLKFAAENNQEINVVVEPQDYDAYKIKYPNFNYLVLPINNGGITYVRNFIKQYTENNSIDYYWQLDDDLTGLFYREGTKLVRTDFNALQEAQLQFKNNNIALGSLEYRQFAWSANKEIILNSFCDSCVFVDNTKLKGLRYREYVEGKEDRDFAMQVIKCNMQTGRTTLFAFSAPANGSNAGGLKEIFYDLGKEKICVNRMVELWGENICVPITKENGRNDIKIMWNNINTNQITLF
jgi:hypothetical protein